MSLRFRLICLIAIVLIASLALEGAIVSCHASRSVRTEMNSALQVGQQFVESALADLADSTDRRGDLEALVAAFKGNRHLRVSLSGGTATVAPSLDGSHFGMVPRWFVRCPDIAPAAASEALDCFASDQKPRERYVLMPTKSAFSALSAPMSLAWVAREPRVEGLALPKSVESGKLSLNKAGIRWMSDQLMAFSGSISTAKVLNIHPSLGVIGGIPVES